MGKKKTRILVSLANAKKYFKRDWWGTKSDNKGTKLAYQLIDAIEFDFSNLLLILKDQIREVYSVMSYEIEKEDLFEQMYGLAKTITHEALVTMIYLITEKESNILYPETSKAIAAIDKHNAFYKEPSVDWLTSIFWDSDGSESVNEIMANIAECLIKQNSDFNARNK